MALHFCQRVCGAPEPSDAYRPIVLSNSERVALVDAEDFERVSRLTWGLRDNGYAQSGTEVAGKNVRLLLHRLVFFGYPPTGPMIQHINRNRLDCRKANLRICTRTQNQATSRRTFRSKSSRFRGVCRCRDRWKAAISGQAVGYFRSEEEAAHAYDKAAAERFGEFATLNFPLEGVAL